MKHFVIILDDSKQPVEASYSGNIPIGEVVMYLYNLSIQEADNKAKELIISMLPEGIRREISNKLKKV